jgi:hypothetical protein
MFRLPLKKIPEFLLIYRFMIRHTRHSFEETNLLSIIVEFPTVVKNIPSKKQETIAYNFPCCRGISRLTAAQSKYQRRLWEQLPEAAIFILCQVLHLLYAADPGTGPARGM